MIVDKNGNPYGVYGNTQGDGVRALICSKSSSPSDIISPASWSVLKPNQSVIGGSSSILLMKQDHSVLLNSETGALASISNPNNRSDPSSWNYSGGAALYDFYYNGETLHLLILSEAVVNYYNIIDNSPTGSFEDYRGTDIAGYTWSGNLYNIIDSVPSITRVNTQEQPGDISRFARISTTFYTLSIKFNFNNENINNSDFYNSILYTDPYFVYIFKNIERYEQTYNDGLEIPSREHRSVNFVDNYNAIFTSTGCKQLNSLPSCPAGHGNLSYPVLAINDSLYNKLKSKIFTISVVGYQYSVEGGFYDEV